MKVDTKSRKFWRLSFVYALLLGFGILFLSGCGNSPSATGAVNNVKEPPTTNGSPNASQQGQAVTVELPYTATLSANALEEAIKTNKELQLVDVRESREFASGHIKMAINRPLADLEKNFAQISKDKEIVLIDLNGTRALSAWQTLIKNGYDQNKIKVLTGGMMEWRGIVSSAGSNAGSDANKSGTSGVAPKAEVQEVKGGC